MLRRRFLLLLGTPTTGIVLGPKLIDLPRRMVRRAQRTTPPLACSFCDASQHDVWKLVAGPNAYICDGCIGDAASFLHAWRDA